MATHRQRFYGSLRVDDIADLAQYVTDHAGSGSGLNWRGTWAPNNAYAVGDAFNYGGSSYLVLTAYTSGASFSATNLALLAAKGTDGAAGTNGADSTVPGPKGDPGPTGASGLTFRGPWSASASYVVNDLVTWGGSGYVTSVTKSAGSPPPTGTAVDPGTDDAAVNSGWTLLVLEGARGPQGIQGNVGPAGQGFTYRGPWNASTTYNAYDILTYAGAAYTVVTGFTSGTTFSATNLSLLADRGGRGAGLITGHGAPTAGMGGTGDLYLDLDTGILYTDGTTAPATSGAFRFRGAYANDVTYANLDVVTYQGATYAFTDTTSASGKLPTTSSWALLAAAGSPGTAGANGSFTVTPWAAGTAYKVNDTYLRGETLYRAVRAHTASPASDPAFGPLTNVYIDPALTYGVIATGAGIWSQQIVADATKSASATGSSVQFYRLSTQMPGTMDNAGIQAYAYDSSTVAGKRVLVRAHVYSTETHTFRLLLGNYPNAVEPPDARNQYSSLITVPANTLTQLNLIANWPAADQAQPVIAISPNPNESAGASSDGSVYYSGFQVTELPAGYSGNGSDVPYVEGYATGEWTGNVPGSTSVYRYQREFTPPAVQPPLTVNPRTSLMGLMRDVQTYDATRTYRSGEVVRTLDGSVWEAVADIPLNQAPIRYNYVPNPILSTGATTTGWGYGSYFSNGTNTGGAPTITATTVAGQQALKFAKPAGTDSTAGLVYVFGETSLTLPRAMTSGIRPIMMMFSLYSDVAMSRLSIGVRGYDSGNVRQLDTFVNLNGIAANTWTTYRAWMNLSSSSSTRYIIGLRGELPGTTVANLYAQNLIVDDRYVATFPSNFTYFDGNAVAYGYNSSAWRGTAGNSTSVMTSPNWRFIAPGVTRFGGVPIQGSSLVGDVDFHYDYGSRTMGL